MRTDKKILRFAKKLVALSIEDGAVSGERVSEILASLRKSPPRDVQALLRVYHRLLGREIAQRTAVVESAGELSSEALRAIEAHFTAHYGRAITAVTQTNPALIAGIRVQVGDDRFDASVQGRLQRLAANVR